MAEIGLGLTLLSLLIWLGLLGFRGQFWQADQRLEKETSERRQEESEMLHPSVCAVIPARNEAELLPITLRSLLTQNYPGTFSIILVDDHSTDGTTQVATEAAQSLGKAQQLNILAAAPLPAGWTGKLWAMEQGIRHGETFAPDYFLLTDADIQHGSATLHQLVAKAQTEDLDLASLMVLLRCQSRWEKLLIPAFVFFFQKLYPFRWVNDFHNLTAAAAGGCILIRREALDRIGGIQAVRQALIDDCALAQAVKSSGQNSVSQATPHSPGKIWLGLTALTCSLRPYPTLSSIWDMVARTAYTQLNYSPWLLLGTLLGMSLIYLVPCGGAVIGGITGNWAMAIAASTAWLLMAVAYLPTLRLYRQPGWLAFSLPAIAFLYTLMTLDSALRHYQGRGGAWKGRVYSLEKSIEE
jgi:hopene-associated glycosyltransferase HpnB